MHRDINPPGQHRLVNFLGKQAFAADIRQPAAAGLAGIAGGADLNFRRIGAGQSRADGLQLRDHVAGLRQSERRGARDDIQRQRPEMRRHLIDRRKIRAFGDRQG